MVLIICGDGRGNNENWSQISALFAQFAINHLAQVGRNQISDIIYYYLAEFKLELKF